MNNQKIMQQRFTKERRKSASTLLPSSITSTSHSDKQPQQSRYQQLLYILLVVSVLYLIGSHLFKSTAPETIHAHTTEVLSKKDVKLSVISTIPPHAEYTQKQSFITDTIQTFKLAVQKNPFPLELIFVIGKGEQSNIESFIREQQDRQLSIEARVLESDQYSNVRAINHGATLASHNTLMLYPYGTRHLLSEKERNFADSSHRWLNQLVAQQITETFKTITGALIYTNGQIHSAGISVAYSGDNRPTLFHRYQGFSTAYKPALKQMSSHPDKKTKDVTVSVNLPGLMISTSLFKELSGFNVEMENYETYAVADLCIRAIALGAHILYNPLHLNHYTITDLSKAEEQVGLSDESIRLSKQENAIVELFVSTHQKYLSSVIDQNLDTRSKVVWDFGAGSCTGWFIEAQQYCVGLENRVNMRVITGRNDMCSGLPSSSIKALDRMISRELHNVELFITHKPPERYPNFPYNGMVKIQGIPKFVVGRSMFESVTLPAKWAEIINKKVDEVWVPSKFLEDAFIADGVGANKVVHLPEPIDVHFYDPQITTPLLTRSTPGSKLKGYNFLSVFKWEERKGPEELIEAYLTTFTDKDDVSLHLVTYMYMDPRGRDPDAVFEAIDSIIDGLKLDRKKLPAYDVIANVIPTTDMPRLYKSFDAFVLPSKGEGWGLPYIEAMTMGLPTIGTRYGGQLDFMNDLNSLLIEVSSMEKTNNWSGELQIIPKISMTSLKSHMRFVYENQEAGRKIGAVARDFVKERFSQEVISDLVVSQIKRVDRKIAKMAEATNKAN